MINRELIDILIFITSRVISECTKNLERGNNRAHDAVNAQCDSLTQKCAITFTLKERSIKWSGVSSSILPDTTPALLKSSVT